MSRRLREKKRVFKKFFIVFSIDIVLYLLKYKLESAIPKMQHLSERNLQDGNDHIQFHRITFRVTTQSPS